MTGYRKPHAYVNERGPVHQEGLAPCHVVLLFLMLADMLVCSRVDDIYADLAQVRRDGACILSHQALTRMLHIVFILAFLQAEHEAMK